jgi:hypothetical protein
MKSSAVFARLDPITPTMIKTEKYRIMIDISKICMYTSPFGLVLFLSLCKEGRKDFTASFLLYS